MPMDRLVALKLSRQAKTIEHAHTWIVRGKAQREEEDFDIGLIEAQL